MNKISSGFIGYFVGVSITALISFPFIIDRDDVYVKYNESVNEGDSLKQELLDCRIRNGRYFHAIIHKDQNETKYDSIITLIAKDN